MNIKIFDQMRASNRRLMQLMLLGTIVLGALEGVFGRVRYSGDAICYLNIVRALHAGNWKLAFNPYWGLGYPMLIALITPLFPSNATAEWVAIHVLNLLILMATFVSFYWLVWTAARSSALQWIVADARAERFLIVGAYAIFLSIELSMDNVSRVGPDALVSCLVFAAATLLLKLRDNPSGSRAIALGLLLGLGFVVKAIFLPLTLIFAVLLLITLWKKQRAVSITLMMSAAACIFAVPYVAGLSWAAGHFTYGDSGALNYAWNVNKLEPGGLWQGQPAGYGTPIHPAQMISADPHTYIFNGPFPVTFGPFFNPPYYYAGYRHFFHLKAQIREAGGNGLRLFKILHLQMVIYALLICWLIGKRRESELRSPSRSVGTLWPLLLLSIGAIGTYLLVFVEARYIASFVAMMMLVLLFAITAQIAAAERSAAGLRTNTILLSILLVSSVCTLLATEKDADRDVLGHALHHRLFFNDEQWAAGNAIAEMGLKPGDKVAVMTDLVSATRSTWAYMDRLQIVGIVGGSLLENQTADFDRYWSAAPEERKRMLEPFQQAGAVAVVAKSKPDGIAADGWQAIAGSSLWVYRF